MAKVNLTREILQEHLHYNPETGVFIRNPGCHGNATPGEPAGYTDTFGHIHISVAGKRYLAHRLAWLYVYGEWPKDGLTIDHKFGKSNAINNLREVTQGVNLQNKQRAQSNNKVGLLGVDKLPSGFRARIKPPGSKAIFLGVFQTPDEAHHAYVEAKRVLHEGGLL